LLLTNTQAYWAYSLVVKIITYCEYGICLTNLD
jgi:hypothetical protein